MRLVTQSAVSCEVRPVQSGSDMRRFRELPGLLYSSDPCGVRPLKMLQDAVLDRKRHPFYNNGQGAVAEFFIAVDRATGRPVGRIGAIIDNRHNELARRQDPDHELGGQFGFFDCVNSPQVAQALIGAAADWLRQRGVKHMLGPASPSQSYDYGLLIEGHQCPHRFLLSYHPAYYAALLEGCGLSKAKDLLSLSGDLNDPTCRTLIEQFIARTATMQARSSVNVTFRPINMRKYRQDARIFGKVLNDALEDHFGHSPITEREWQLITDSLRPFVNPDFILLAEQDGEPIGLTIGVPDLNEIIGRLRLRFGLLETLEFLLRSWRSKPQCISVIVAGVNRKYSKFGVAPMLIGQLVRNLLAHKVRFVNAHQVLEDNHPILDPLLRHGFQADRRHRVYQLALSEASDQV